MNNLRLREEIIFDINKPKWTEVASGGYLPNHEGAR